MDYVPLTTGTLYMKTFENAALWGHKMRGPALCKLTQVIDNPGV